MKANILVVSDKFIGLRRLEKIRVTKEALGTHLISQLDTISITTRSVDQFRAELVEEQQKQQSGVEEQEETQPSVSEHSERFIQ